MPSFSLLDQRKTRSRTSLRYCWLYCCIWGVIPKRKKSLMLYHKTCGSCHFGFHLFITIVSFKMFTDRTKNEICMKKVYITNLCTFYSYLLSYCKGMFTVSFISSVRLPMQLCEFVRKTIFRYSKKYFTCWWAKFFLYQFKREPFYQDFALF